MNDPKMIARFLRDASPSAIVCLGYIEKAADAIEQLVADNESYKCAFADLHNEIANYCETIATLEKERDAAVADLKGLHDALEGRGLCCYACKNDVFDYDKSVCAGCALQDNWEWRGVMEDNDETD